MKIVKGLTLFLIILIKCSNLTAQSYFFVVTGKVIDNVTEIELKGAKISIPKLGKVFISDSNGDFKFALTRGKYEILIENVEYIPIQMVINLQCDTFIVIPLKDKVKQILLEEVKVFAHQKVNVKEAKPGLIGLTQIEVQNIPTLGGEKDIIKAIQTLPGVHPACEGSAGLVVRGGAPEQNLYLLDNVRLYNTNHGYGLLSSYNPAMVKSVDFYRGGFPARYGGFVSSVLDVKSKEAIPENLDGSLDLGIISSSINLSSPLPYNGGVIVSGRRTFLDLIANLSSDYNLIPYSFYDFSSKLIFGKDKHFISLGYYTSKDVMKMEQNNGGNLDENKFTNKWGTNMVNLTSRYIPNNRVNNEFQIFYTSYKLSLKDEYVSSKSNLNFNSEVLSSISTLGASNILNFQLFDSIDVSVGGNLFHHSYNPAQVSGSYDSQSINFSYIPSSVVLETGLFAELNIELPLSITLVPGLRYDIFNYSSTTTDFLQWRLAAQKKLFKNNYLKFSYTQNVQASHYLSNTGIGVPVDVWLPASDILPEQKAQQITLGVYSSLKDYTITLECFYKKMYNILSYLDGHSSIDFLRSYSDASLVWDKTLTQGTGNAKGLEFFIEKSAGRFSGWSSYTLSWSINQFDKLNYGNEFWSPYDRRHALNIAGGYLLNKNWRIGFNWQYMSGQPVTMPLSYYVVDNENLINGNNYRGEHTLVWEYGIRNNFRMKSTHHLDINIKRNLNEKRFKGSLEIGCYNVYNRKNPYYYFGKLEYSDGNIYGVIKGVSLFPAIPYFNIKWNPMSTFGKRNNNLSN